MILEQNKKIKKYRFFMFQIIVFDLQLVVIFSFFFSPCLLVRFLTTERKNRSKPQLSLSVSLQTFRKCSSHEYFDFRKFEHQRTSICMPERPKPSKILLKSWAWWRNFAGWWQKFKNESLFCQNHQLHKAVTLILGGVRQ